MCRENAKGPCVPVCRWCTSSRARADKGRDEDENCVQGLEGSALEGGTVSKFKRNSTYELFFSFLSPSFPPELWWSHQCSTASESHRDPWHLIHVSIL